MCCAIVAQSLFEPIRTQLMLVALIALVMMAAGIATRLEPAISLSLSDNKLRYYHRYGQWTQHWSDVSRIFQPSFSHGLTSHNIPYIGIKLKDLESIAEKISPRLASRLIHEQRDIVVLARQQGELSNEQATINFAPYKTNNGYQITGPVAAWLHHVEGLHQAYGAHLYVPHSATSLSSEQLVTLLSQSHHAALLAKQA